MPKKESRCGRKQKGKRGYRRALEKIAGRLRVADTDLRREEEIGREKWALSRKRSRDYSRKSGKLTDYAEQNFQKCDLTKKEKSSGCVGPSPGHRKPLEGNK